jgi:hypothetical protein
MQTADLRMATTLPILRDFTRSMEIRSTFAFIDRAESYRPASVSGRSQFSTVIGPSVIQSIARAMRPPSRDRFDPP